MKKHKRRVELWIGAKVERPRVKKRKRKRTKTKWPEDLKMYQRTVRSKTTRISSFNRTMPSFLPPLCVLIVCLALATAAIGWSDPHERQNRQRAKLHKEVVSARHLARGESQSERYLRGREARWRRHNSEWRRWRREVQVESVVNRLRILESLDEQLRAFSAAAELAQDERRQQQAANHLAQRPSKSAQVSDFEAGQIYCQLSVAAGATNEVAHRPGSNRCLDDKRLLKQIPPYMLNLYRQLLFELHQDELAKTNNTRPAPVQLLLPYKAQIMRSFRQPKIFGGAQELQTAAMAQQSDDRREKSRNNLEGQQFEGREVANILVELSNVSPPPLERFEFPRPRMAETSIWQSRRRTAKPTAACPSEQRLLDVSRRQEICFWFDLSENFAMSPANKTLEFVAKTGDTPAQIRQISGRTKERLLEAELHVFKLFPESANSVSLQPNRTGSGTNFFHLRTNLLEVSLYQILARRPSRPATSWTGHRNSNGQSSNDSNEPEAEFPLRLLDIRRIDLNSNGWETFYVKRAVEDWLRDPSLNLGLVIRAKSMFDEPIKAGLIRFADAYDHYARPPEPGMLKGADTEQQYGVATKQAEATWDFDLSHQPLLVIYTTLAHA